MEDALIVNLSLGGGQQGGDDAALFGVFDGHGGREVAEFCAREIEAILQGLESFQRQEYETALRECFIELDTQLSQLEGQNKIVQISREIQEE